MKPRNYQLKDDYVQEVDSDFTLQGDQARERSRFIFLHYLRRSTGYYDTTNLAPQIFLLASAFTNHRHPGWFSHASSTQAAWPKDTSSPRRRYGALHRSLHHTLRCPRHCRYGSCTRSGQTHHLSLLRLLGSLRYSGPQLWIR